MKALFAFLFLSLIYLSEASVSVTYEVTQLNGTTCVVYPALPACVACGNYYYYVTDEYGFLEAEYYTDSACSNLAGFTYLYYETCGDNYWYSNCQLFYQPTSISGYTLSLSSTAPIKADYLGDYVITSSLSQNKITASGNIAGLIVQSTTGNPNFRFEQQLSATQYSTTFGVFNFGDTYTSHSYTFSVTPSTIDLPIPVTTQHLVNFETVVGAWVENENEYSISTEYEGELIVATDELSFDGLVFSNPIYSVKNMSVYEPYEISYRGHVVFQLYSASRYFTGDCYYETKSGYDNYNCNLGSLSISGIFSLSFSLDKPLHAQPVNVDDMAVSLF